MSKHTPGPWRVQLEISKSFISDDSQTHHQIYTDAPIKGGRFIGEASNGAADARLIAAAPEMYDFILSYAARNDGHDLDRARALLARIDEASAES